MEDDGGLFSIELSSSDTPTTFKKASRDFQSEEEFNIIKREWKPKIEKGEVWKIVKMPTNDMSLKADSQILLNSIEELYFFRRYEEAEKVTGDALEGELRDDLRNILQNYQKRCRAKLDTLRDISADHDSEEHVHKVS